MISSLIIVILLLIIYIIYLMVAKRALWEDYNVEKVRRAWETAYFYYKTHFNEIESLEKKHFLEDFPLLQEIFAKSSAEEIKKSVKDCYAPLLPYLNNIDKFIDEALYKSRPPFLSKLWRKFIKNKKYE